MATAVLPIRIMSHHSVNSKSLPPRPTTSSSCQEPPTSADVLESTRKPLKRLRSSIEQTLRTVTRSRTTRTKPVTVSQSVNESSTPDKGKGKDKQSGDDVMIEQGDNLNERLKGLKRFESKVGFRSRLKGSQVKPSVLVESSALPPIIGKTKDGGGNNVNVKIHEGGNTRIGGSASFITPALRQASMSSPALHLASQAIPSPKSQSAVLASSNSNTSILVSPSRDKARRSSVRAAEEISGSIPLSSTKRDRVLRNNDAWYTNSTPSKLPTLSSPSSPAHVSNFQVSSPVTPPRRGHSRPRTPDTPTPASESASLFQHKNATASTNNALLNSPSTSPISSSGSSIHARSPSIRVPPSQRGSTSASKSNLYLSSNSPFQTTRRPSIDAQRHPSLDSSCRGSIDYQRRPSVDHRLSGSASPQSASPSSHFRPRAERANSFAYASNRNFNVSSTSLAPTSTPEQREIVRSAIAILCKEMRRPPSHPGTKEWEDVDVRMQPLVRLQRIWGRSGGTPGESSTPLNNVVAGMGSTGLSAGGEDRERRMFSQALRDGFVLCQCVLIFNLLHHRWY